MSKVLEQVRTDASRQSCIINRLAATPDNRHAREPKPVTDARYGIEMEGLARRLIRLFETLDSLEVSQRRRACPDSPFRTQDADATLPEPHRAGMTWPIGSNIKFTRCPLDTWIGGLSGRMRHGYSGAPGTLNAVASGLLTAELTTQG